MYTESRHNVRLHKGSYNFCESKAKDRVMIVAFMILKKALGCMRLKNKLLQWFNTIQFGSTEECTKWLLQTHEVTNIYNYMVLVALFYSRLSEI